MKVREDFSSEVIRIAKMRAAFICSNPKCRVLTIAPSLTDEMGIQYSGKVAHISAAAPKGPRYDGKMSKKNRTDISNAIFLCSNCADIVDKNEGKDYSVEILRKWKDQHNDWVTKNLNRNSQNGADITSNGQLGGITANNVTILNSVSEDVPPNVAHDKGIFMRSKEIFDDETMIVLSSNLMCQGMCNILERDKLMDICCFFERTGNSFVSDTIDKAKSIFAKKARNLVAFMDSEFDKWPYHQRRDDYTIQLRPNYLRDTEYIQTTDERRKLWFKLFKKLKEKLNATNESYISFRKQVKCELYI